MKPVGSMVVLAAAAASVAAVGAPGENPEQGPDAPVDRLEQDIERIRGATEGSPDLPAAHDAGTPPEVPGGRESRHPPYTQEAPSMDTTLEASFEITGWEETDLVDDDGVRVYRADVTKSFTGDIEGSSESWLVMTTTPSGPAAYVGLEVLEVSIGERDGTFVLKHDAVATDEGQTADWTVVPGSGTGDLADIAGTAEIERHDDGSHTLTLTLE